MSDKQLHTLNATMIKQQSQVTYIPQSECICRLGLGFEQVIQCECELACKRIPSYALHGAVSSDCCMRCRQPTCSCNRIFDTQALQSTKHSVLHNQCHLRSCIVRAATAGL